MTIPILAIYLLLLGGIAAIVFLQNSRSIFVRCIGIFLILITITLYKAQNGINDIDIIAVGISLVYAILAFLSDFYSPTLRTWYFSVSKDTMRITFFSILFSLLFLPLAFKFTTVPSLLIGTMIGPIIGEIKAGKKSVSRILKSVFGTLTGLYGMGLKVLLGLLMIDEFLFENFLSSIFASIAV